MYSVTSRIKVIKQPKGGYLNPSKFVETALDDGKTLEDENIHASLVGMAVDYLTRFMTGDTKLEAFDISRTGYNSRLAMLDDMFCYEQDVEDGVDFITLINKIVDLDDESIIAACKLVTYDVWYRNPDGARRVMTAVNVNPDASTINNIRIMVQRSMRFWQIYGPVLYTGFTFGWGYTDTVSSGDGDYLTKDTIWDFKVSKYKITTQHTLQILMYYIMGKHSEKPEFDDITKLGFFNPRLNMVYLIDAADIPIDVIRAVEDDVICY